MEKFFSISRKILKNQRSAKKLSQLADTVVKNHKSDEIIANKL